MNREPFKLRTWIDNKNKNIVYDGKIRYQFGNNDWRGIWGSNGTGVTQSI